MGLFVLTAFVLVYTFIGLCILVFKSNKLSYTTIISTTASKDNILYTDSSAIWKNKEGSMKTERSLKCIITLVSYAVFLMFIIPAKYSIVQMKPRIEILRSVKNHIFLHHSPQHHGHITDLLVFPLSQKNLDSYFSTNTEDLSVSMCYEWLRLRSFSVLNSRPNISPIRLANAGLYFVPERNVIVCYSCSLEIQMNRDIDPNSFHQMLSPNCRHILRTDERNVPVSRDSSSAENDVSRRMEILSVAQESCNTSPRDETVTSMTNYAQSNSPRRAECQTSTRNSNSSEPERRHPTSSQGRPQEVLQSLGISFDKPRYPAYAILTVRISSYQGWPSYMTQTPRMLALAGFFYAGYGDYVRCFFCGGGLRNWDDGDDPWVEHARWFPRCTFLRMNKGEEFVLIVQEQHQAGNVGSSNRESEQMPLPSRKEEENNTRTRSILAKGEEMGFTKEVILSAIQTFASTNRKDVSSVTLDEVVDFVLIQGQSATGTTRNDTNSTEKKESSEVEQQSKETKDSKRTNKGEAMETRSTNGSKSMETKISGSGSSSESSLDKKSSLLEENRQLRRQRECKICLDAEACIALLPCGHLCCCPECASAMRKCPICRKFVRGTVRTYPT